MTTTAAKRFITRSGSFPRVTESLGRKFPDLVKTVRTEHKKPLLIEIPDRHGTGRRPDFITAYVNDAIGLKL